MHKKIIIIGSGPAGYTAAVYASRANLSPMLITGAQKGGQLTTTTEIENFPGFPDGVDGNELMGLMEKQAERLGTEMVLGDVIETDLSKRPFTIKTDSENYTRDALVIARRQTEDFILFKLFFPLYVRFKISIGKCVQ